MNVQFDYFGQPEIPYIVLCNPDKTQLYSLGLAYNTELNLQFNTLSEFKFTFPESIDGGTTTIDAYEYIQNKRLVLVEGYGYFIVVDCQEDLNGFVPLKNVSCESLETDLIFKRITGYSGTVALYNIISPSGTLLYDMIQLAPTWSIGSIDGELMTKFRTFDISDTNIYNFLMSDVSKAFECVFFFDTTNKTISVKTIDNATIETDIFMSFDNVIKQAKFSEKSDEITTCLSVYGGGDLNIRSVNPLGTNSIYDFSYYANANWMSAGLISAINDWSITVDDFQEMYAEQLSILFDLNSELIILNGELITLNSEFVAIEGQIKVRVQNNETYADLIALLIQKRTEIANKTNEIDNKEDEIEGVRNIIISVNTFLSFEQNFTPAQLLELNNFIYENTYKNENIIQTDSMTTVEVQEAGQSLYDQAITVLERVSQPRYEIELDSINYPALQEFSIFTNQTSLGSVVTAEIKDGVYVQTVLLKMTFRLDNPLDFKMVFSNRVRLDGEGFIYSDLAGSIIKTGSDVSFDNYNWGNWSSDYKDDVSSFITSALDATTNNLISNSNQEILINQNGLRARQSTGTGTYSNKQAWLVNNVLAFSDDGFVTSKLALGEISIPGGGTAYGLVGDVIVGHLLAGNSLRISNSGNNFVLDQTGATLTNAKLTLQDSSNKTHVAISPLASTFSGLSIDPGIAILANVGGTWQKKFWVDNTGNVNFSGVLSGATGTFRGSLSAATGTFSGSLSGATGTFSGSLNAASGTFVGDISAATGTFSGDVFANRLLWDGNVQVFSNDVGNFSVVSTQIGLQITRMMYLVL